MSASNARPLMLFGIQGKVALLVIAATAASALLVAKVLTGRAAEALREHELVDLGDEAALRCWEIIDQIDGLRDDLVKLAISTEFKDAVAANVSPDELKKIARAQCRRNWQNHLRIDVLENTDLSQPVRLIHEKGRVDEKDFWFPGTDAMAGAGLHFSPIRRLHLTRLDVGGEPLERWEPVIWAVAPLFRPDQNETVKHYIRIMMTLHSPESPRHLFTIIDEGGTMIVRPDETEAADQGNDGVFAALREHPELVAAITRHEQRFGNPASPEEEPKVDRLLLSKLVRLHRPFYFQEGQPNGDISAALEAMDEDAVESLLEDLQDRFGRIVRIGGLLSGVREIRLLGHSPEEIAGVREQIEEALAERFPAAASGTVDWRNVIECDDIHSWAVRMLVGEGETQSVYLIQYAVLDDELASSIEYEMISVQSISLLVAGGFGLLGFLFAMRFIRPLKQMTVTAQKITESPRDDLLREIAGLAQRLDLKRRDEVGDIARASKRLFEEIIASQADLEQRVNDRTRELRRTNIELEKANEKLKGLSHEKDAFVAKVSHDLRQPLNAIFLQVEALSLSQLDETQKKDVQRIRDHAARELNLVNDILEYQKIIMGAETLDRDEVDVASLLEDLCETHRSQLSRKPVTLEVSYPADIGELVSDERRLRQVLGNLLGNACKFTREGTITLGARPQMINGVAWLEFTVTDTGRGMSPSEQAQAFVPFVSNKKDNAGGSGLGLSICRELVAQMGGKIGFVSELDKGTHFSVFLPRVPASDHDDPGNHRDVSADPTEDLAPGESRGTTILVIDDDGTVRDLLTRLLEKDGHHVITAADGKEGLALAEQFHPDVITLDVVMPGGMDGWEVLRILKESPVTQAIPVIMVSVMAGQEHAHTLEVEDYLVKPIDVDRLARSINRITHRVPQRNLLLIDDDEASLESMSRILGAAGWHTTSARNGKEGLDLLAKTRPAAIVLDLIMPEMDGFEFLHHLRSHPQMLSIPVIVMSGKDPSPEERAFLLERADTVIKKGKLTSAELLAAVKARLRQVKEA